MSNNESMALLAEDTNEATQNSIRKTKKRSPVWKHFEEIPSEGKVICIHCRSKLAYHQGIGVSHLRNHVTSACKELPPDIDRNSIFPKGVLNVDVRSFVVDPKLVRDLATKFWITANIPFKKIENGFFKRMLKSAHPALEIRDPHTLENDCMLVYQEERKKIANGFANIDSCVSFTSDMWTSAQNLGYICLTAHFIDGEFNLHKRTINFKQVPHPHNAAAIHSTIMDCLYEWELSNKAFAFTLDNATSNDKVVKKLQETLWAHMPFEGDDLHIKCTSHILNLVVQDGMATLRDVIEPVRNIIKHISSSSSRLQTFNTIPHQFNLQPKKGFTLDVSTRWNSMYEMLEEALEYKDALTHYANLQNIQGPNLEQWNLADRVCKFLKNFADTTKVFSQHNSPSCHRYVEEIWGIRELLLDDQNRSDKFFKRLCDDMKSKFDKYWDQPNKILLVASLLDPRYKLIFLKYCLMKVYGEEAAGRKANDALIRFRAYYAHYESMIQRSSQNNVSLSSEVGGSASMLSSLSGKRKLGLEFALFRQQSRPHRSTRSEVDTYQDDPLVQSKEGEEFDVLRWWKRNQDKYPMLAKMARDFLAIPLSTVASESTFSTAGMIIDKYHNPLSSETVEALICAKDWLKVYLSDDEDDNGILTDQVN
ncbi:hypothetical protein BS78_08G157500 [Paspalum vaginatum]|nr:hypothetical protein BS78_08G157500 [Paspalum vaginatum]